MLHRVWAVLAILAVTLGCGGDGGGKDGGGSDGENPRSTVAAVTFTPRGGTYDAPQQVALACATPGAAIRYTVDGSGPTSAAGILYTGPVDVVSSTTLRAIAFLGGWQDSALVEAIYEITEAVATPTFDPAGGTYPSAQSVTISTTTPGAQIRYTTDGSAPTSTAGTVYTGPVDVASDTTLRAIAFLQGSQDSAVAEAAYEITGTKAFPIVDKFVFLGVAYGGGGFDNDVGFTGAFISTDGWLSFNLDVLANDSGNIGEIVSIDVESESVGCWSASIDDPERPVPGLIISNDRRSLVYRMVAGPFGSDIGPLKFEFTYTAKDLDTGGTITGRGSVSIEPQYIVEYNWIYKDYYAVHIEPDPDTGELETVLDTHFHYSLYNVKFAVEPLYFLESINYYDEQGDIWLSVDYDDYDISNRTQGSFPSLCPTQITEGTEHESSTFYYPSWHQQKYSYDAPCAAFPQH